MYQDLPEPVQQQVRDYLLADDFKTAKAVHDHWMANNPQEHMPCYPDNFA